MFHIFTDYPYANSDVFGPNELFTQDFVKENLSKQTYLEFNKAVYEYFNLNQLHSYKPHKQIFLNHRNV